MSVIKLGVIGRPGSGKSAFVLRFIKGEFVEDYDPTIEDSYRKQVTIDNKAYLFDILDTYGAEEYSAMRDRYMRSLEGAIFCVPVNEPFDKFDETHIEQVIRVKDVDKFDPMLMVVTKMDLADEYRKVSDEELHTFALKYGMSVMYTSAKDDVGVTEVFHRMMHLVVEYRGEQDSYRKPAKKRIGRTGCVSM